MERSMATIRVISAVNEHLNSDNLALVQVDGWQVVVKKGEFVKGEKICFLEVDSWVPSSVASFLSKGKEPREYRGVKGERLKTIKLRKELSQGLILPMPILENCEGVFNTGDDVSELLNIRKWERPLSPQLEGLAEGNFPTFIKKTDQTRIQNQFNRMTREHFEDEYEATLKMDGSSCTFFYNNGEVGVCSRNLELKTDESNENNAFVKMFNELGLREKLTKLGRNIAIQGELWGIGINGNHEGISGTRYTVYDVFDIDTQKYLTAQERYSIVDFLDLEHVKVISIGHLKSFTSVKDFLTFAEMPSIYNKVAEGVVFKSVTKPDYSFKAISNTFLLNGGE